MEEKNTAASESQQPIHWQIDVILNSHEVPLRVIVSEEPGESIGGDKNFIDVVDLDFEPQLYPGTGISAAGGGSDEETSEFARNAFGGSDYNDDLDMDQQSQAYWENL